MVKEWEFIYATNADNENRKLNISNCLHDVRWKW